MCVCVDLEPVLFLGRPWRHAPPHRPIFGSDLAVGTYGVLSHIGQRYEVCIVGYGEANK